MFQLQCQSFNYTFFRPDSAAILVRSEGFIIHCEKLHETICNYIQELLSRRKGVELQRHVRHVKLESRHGVLIVVYLIRG